MGKTHRKSKQWWNKEDKLIRINLWRSHRHQNKVLIKNGNEPIRWFNTRGWKTW